MCRRVLQISRVLHAHTLHSGLCSNISGVVRDGCAESDLALQLRLFRWKAGGFDGLNAHIGNGAMGVLQHRRSHFLSDLASGPESWWFHRLYRSVRRRVGSIDRLLPQRCPTALSFA